MRHLFGAEGAWGHIGRSPDFAAAPTSDEAAVATRVIIERIMIVTRAALFKIDEATDLGIMNEVVPEVGVHQNLVVTVRE